MGKKCAALFCRSGYDVTKKEKESDSHSSLTKHVFCFPKDIEIRRKWVEALGRPNLREDNCSHSGVCELHFLPNDFSDKSKLKQRLRLKREAVPTVLGHEAQKRRLRQTSLAATTARRRQSLLPLEDKAESFLLADKIAGLAELEERLLSERIPSGFR